MPSNNQDKIYRKFIVLLQKLGRNRIMQWVAVVELMIVAGVFSYAVTSHVLAGSTKPKKVNIVSTSEQKKSSLTTTTEQPSTSTSQQAEPSVPTPVTSNTPSSTPKPAAVFCGVKDMPEGVCLAITSIQKDGFKNNKYVTANTSSLPSGVSITIDTASWFQAGPEIGICNFSTTYSGKKVTGLLSWQLGNGIWKVVSYSINQ